MAFVSYFTTQHESLPPKKNDSNLKPLLLNGDKLAFEGEDDLGVKFCSVIRNIITFIQSCIQPKNKLSSIDSSLPRLKFYSSFDGQYV